MAEAFGTRLEYVQGSSNKFYEAAQVTSASEFFAVLRWGARTARGQCKVVRCPSASSVRRVVQDVLYEKQAKGYVPVVEGLRFTCATSGLAAAAGKMDPAAAAVMDAFSAERLRSLAPELAAIRSTRGGSSHDAALRVALVERFALDARSEPLAAALAAALSDLPHAAGRAGALAAVLPSGVLQALRSGTAPVHDLGPALDTDGEVLETLLGVWDPLLPGPMSDPVQALAAARMLGGM